MRTPGSLDQCLQWQTVIFVEIPRYCQERQETEQAGKRLSKVHFGSMISGDAGHHTVKHCPSFNVFSDIPHQDTYNTGFVGKWRVAQGVV